MTEHDKADEARKGLIDSVKGKVKEVAGAVTGNDSLTAEGQLEQTQAKERKEANSVEAVADAEAAQAHARGNRSPGRRRAGPSRGERRDGTRRRDQCANQQADQKRTGRAGRTTGSSPRRRLVPSSTRRPRFSGPKTRSAPKWIRAAEEVRRRGRRSSDHGSRGVKREGGGRPHQTASRQTDQPGRPALSTGKKQELSMRIIDAPLAVLRVQYRIARFPLQLIEQRVVARMGSEAPARLFYERSLGLLDAAMGNALGDRRLQRSGSALARRSDVLGRAARLDAEADQAQRRSSADLKATSDEASEEQQDALAAKERKVEEARVAADERKRAAEEAAAQRTAAAKKQADDAAAQRIEVGRGGQARRACQDPGGGTEGRRGCQVQARRCSSEAHRSRRQARTRTGPFASRTWRTTRSASVSPPARTTSNARALASVRPRPHWS